MTHDAAPLRKNARLGAWLLDEPLGQGGMGCIWRARHVERPDLRVAIKILSTRHAHDARQRQRLVREIQSAARLDHPHIVRVLDHGVVAAHEAGQQLPEGVPWLAMELASNRDSVSAIARGGWPSVRAALLAVLDALGYAHARGIVHRDLKPGNVLLGPDGQLQRLKLSDFGLAHAVEPSRSDAHPVIDAPSAGTPSYMAPEQFDGDWRNYGPWTDLYALGCLAWELCTGAPPFAGDTIMALAVAHLRRPVPRFEPRFAVPDGLEGWLQRLLVKKAWHRYQCAADAAHALSGLPAAADAGLDLHPIEHDDVSPAAPTHIPHTWLATPAPATATIDEAQLPDDGAELWTEVELDSEVSDPALARLLDPVDTPPVPAGWAHDGDRRVRRPAAPSLFGLRDVPLVGRMRERDVLWSALASVRHSGRPRVVLIEGSSGTGKSRLARWLTERAHELGMATTVLHAHHSSMRAPHDAVYRMVASHLRTLGLSDALAERQVETVLAELDPIAEQLGVSLSAQRVCRLALGLHDDASQVHGLDGSGEQVRHETVLDIVRLWTRARPVILWLDDVQWGLDALELTRTLLARPATLPVLVVATVRTDALARRPLESRRLETLRGDPAVTPVRLEPLSEPSMTALVESVVDAEPALVDAIVRRARRTPLFALHLLGELLDHELRAEVQAGRLVLTAPADEVLPPTPEALWAQQIERIVDGDADVGTALTLAALLGPHVDRGVWRAACRSAGMPTHTVEHALEPLVEALVEHRLAARILDGWAFVHARLVEWLSALAHTSPARWRALHLACADALRTVSRRGHHNEDAEQRAHHLLAADRLDEALDALQRGIERMRHIDVEYTAWLIDRYDQLLDTHVVVADDDHRIRALLFRARQQLETGDAVRSLALVDRAFVLLGGRPANAALQAEAWHAAGMAHRFQGTLQESLEAFERAASHHEALGDEVGVDRMLRYQFDVRVALGQTEGMREGLEALATRYAQRRDRGGECGTLRLLALVGRLEGRLNDARVAVLRGLELAHRMEARYVVVVDLLSTLGDIQRESGDPQAAERTYREALGLMEDVSPYGACVVRLNLALALLSQGRIEDARDELESLYASPIVEKSDFLRFFVAGGLLACAAERNDLPACRALLEETEALLAAVGAFDPDGARCAQLAADALARHGHVELAERAAWLADAQSREF